MKRSILLLAVLSLALSGCSGSETPESPRESPSSVESLMASPTPTPTPEPEPSPSSSGLCAKISFERDPSIPTGFTCEYVPVFDYEDVFHEPEHALIGLPEGEGIGDIYVYPIESDPDVFSDDVSEIETLVAGAPLVPTDFGYYGPFKPGGYTWGAVQTLFAQYEVLEFDGHAGIRYLTDFRQDVGAPTEALYTYQGVTTDGRYWIAVLFNADHAILDDGNGAFTDTITWDTWCMSPENYTTCIADITEALNAQPDGSFTPSLEDLDALVASITIEP